MLWYATKASDGEDVLLNAEYIIALKRNGKHTIAIAFGGVPLDIEPTLEECASHIKALYDTEDEDNV